MESSARHQRPSTMDDTVLRKELLRDLIQVAPSLAQVSVVLWAFLQLSDLETLRGLVQSHPALVRYALTRPEFVQDIDMVMKRCELCNSSLFLPADTLTFA